MEFDVLSQCSVVMSVTTQKAFCEVQVKCACGNAVAVAQLGMVQITIWCSKFLTCKSIPGFGDVTSTSKT